jgi:phospholipase C
MKLDRRDFLRGAALTSGAAFLKPTVGLTSAAQLPEVEADAALLRSPEESGIEHVVVVMMENRSFDHFLGWLPGADGKQSGLTYLDSAGTQHSRSPLSTE